MSFLHAQWRFGLGGHLYQFCPLFGPLAFHCHMPMGSHQAQGRVCFLAGPTASMDRNTR